MGDTLRIMFERLDSRRDVLTEVLQAVQLGSALSARVSVRAPWSLHYGEETGHRAGFHVVVHGSCWAWCDGTEEYVRLDPGDVVLFPHGAGHVLADDLATPPHEFGRIVATLAPGGCVALPFDGSSDGVATVLLCGSYSFGREGSTPLLRGLPEMVHLPAGSDSTGGLAAIVELLANEARDAASGTGLVVDRLVDLLFVQAIRTWLAQGDRIGGGWLAALHDPMIGAAIRAIHDDPAHPWTVGGLAERVGVSRAVFARRFREDVGEPPLAYITRWRMTVAAELLEDGASIVRAASAVGYVDEFAFAKAFKRLRGVTPGQHRARYQHRQSRTSAD